MGEHPLFSVGWTFQVCHSRFRPALLGVGMSPFTRSSLSYSANVPMEPQNLSEGNRLVGKWTFPPFWVAPPKKPPQLSRRLKLGKWTSLVFAVGATARGSAARLAAGP